MPDKADTSSQMLLQAAFLACLEQPAVEKSLRSPYISHSSHTHTHTPIHSSFLKHSRPQAHRFLIPPTLITPTRPQLRLAALNQPYTGDMRGVTGVDYTCYREARRAGLSGIFRAFLTSRIQNLDSIVRSDANLPVVRIHLSSILR
ncbi:collagen alpha-1(XVIII) chain-like [Portunus trituberculatus]|uniref:collagen alpha-1(XVIII) chain-like n=1 Tax=Portunus trituberculatus TaxID=210409 RepID=UPI001E1CC629|nr:collagen alpha-1(XVIII) chain-like [Portunus trituberculatus]